MKPFPVDKETEERRKRLTSDFKRRIAVATIAAYGLKDTPEEWLEKCWKLRRESGESR